jgi:F0F1-type ATP synthase membrane subunit b/b'
MQKLKSYFKRLWKALWDSTDLDEKAEAALKEAKARIAEMRKELVDVKNAAKNTIAQAKDVADAARGKKRRGRKPYYKNKKKKTNNNTTKK